MKNYLSVGLVACAAVIASSATCRGDELFGVYQPAYIDSATGKGVSNKNVLWNLNALAEDKQGRLFSISEGALVQVDPYAVTLTPVLALKGLGGATGLAFSPQGGLFAVGRGPNGLDQTDPLYRIETALWSGDGRRKHRYLRRSRHYAFTQGTLYGWSINAGLITIDPQTGRGTAVNSEVGAPVEIQALTFGTDGTLYGARDALFKIDPTTGIPIEIGAGGYSDIRGLALIPEPPSIALLAIGLCGLLWAGSTPKRQLRAGVQRKGEQTDAPNPAVAPLFHVERHWRRVGDPGR